MNADLRQRIAAALRDEAHVCDDDCQPDYDCAEHQPVEATTVHTNGDVEEVRGSVEALAEVAAAAVQPELDRTRAELATAREPLAAIALIRVWRNEDGQEFMFADDIRTALGVPTRAVSAPTD